MSVLKYAATPVFQNVFLYLKQVLFCLLLNILVLFS